MTSTSRQNMNIEAAIYQLNQLNKYRSPGVSHARTSVNTARYIYTYIYMSLSRYIFIYVLIVYVLISFFHSHSRAVCPVRTTRKPGPPSRLRV